MPTINQQQPGDPVEILADYVDQDGWGINPSTRTTTSFSFVDLAPPTTLGSMAITGTGFTYLDFGGEIIPTGGTVQTLKINPGYIIIGQPAYVPLEITGLGLSVTQLLLAAQNGEDAVRELFAGLQWTWNGSAGNDSFVGGNQDDYLTGNNGNDAIHGGAGSDTIIGDDGLPANDGNDTLFGDAGNDFMYGYGGIDNMAGGTGDDYMSAGTGNDFIYGNEDNDRLYGQSGTDTIVGGTGSDLLDGGSDADTMTGGAGNDSYYVDNAGDQTIETNGAGSDRVYSSVSYSVSRQFIENIYLTGSANLSATGNNLANEIVGNSGNNVINGGAGADRMVGGLGNDTYYVDNAGDVIAEANGAGSDKVFSSISYSIATQNVENMYLTGSGNLSAAGNNLANGIVGNAGNNVLNGGLGSDYLVGGAGNDFFTFNTALGASNVDTINDFNVAQDTIRVDNAIFTALGGAGALAASAFHIGTAAHDANDRIIYNSSTGALFYDSNGSAAGGAIQFAILSKGLGMTNADFLIV